LELPHYGARGTSRGCPLKHCAIGFRDGDGYTGVGHRRAIGTYTRGNGYFLASCVARLIGCQGDTEIREEGYCRRGRGGGGRVSAVRGGHTAGVEPGSRCGWRGDLQRRGGARPRAEGQRWGGRIDRPATGRSRLQSKGGGGASGIVVV